MTMRDQLRQDALQLRLEANVNFSLVLDQQAEELQQAKKIKHSKLIEANRMEKEAQNLHDCMNEELALEIEQDNQASAAYDFQSVGHMAAVFLSKS